MYFYYCLLWMKPMGGWLWKIMISIKSEDLIEGIIKCGNTCSWTTMEIEINTQMVETSLPVNEPLRHIIPAVKNFSIYVECSSLLSGRWDNYSIFLRLYFYKLGRWNFVLWNIFVSVCLISFFFCYKLYYPNFRVSVFYNAVHILYYYWMYIYWISALF